MQIVRRKFSWGTFAFGFGAGALSAALLDPRRGAARRALVRDKAISYGRWTIDEAERMARDFLQRATGRVYELRHRDEEVPDDLLLERVRAQIGRPLSHPRLVEIQCDRGEVILTGHVLRAEVVPLLDILSKVRGVRAIRNELQVHDAEAELHQAHPNIAAPRV